MATASSLQTVIFYQRARWSVFRVYFFWLWSAKCINHWIGFVEKIDTGNHGFPNELWIHPELYPLVTYKKLWNIIIFNGEIHYKSPFFQFANCKRLPGRVFFWGSSFPFSQHQYIRGRRSAACECDCPEMARLASRPVRGKRFVRFFCKVLL